MKPIEAGYRAVIIKAHETVKEVVGTNVLVVERDDEVPQRWVIESDAVREFLKSKGDPSYGTTILVLRENCLMRIDDYDPTEEEERELAILE